MVFFITYNVLTSLVLPGDLVSEANMRVYQLPLMLLSLLFLVRLNIVIMSMIDWHMFICCHLFSSL